VDDEWTLKEMKMKRNEIKNIKEKMDMWKEIKIVDVKKKKWRCE
jgi:hypothetical protein